MTTMNKVPSHHPKYRTKLCRNFVSGNCPFGQRCSFLHPPLGIFPSSVPIAQQLLNWNLLLPQLLALSSQQNIKPTMTWKSPPPPQAPQLVDEDPSPSSSLLLSTSDCTSSEQMPQTKTYTKRHKYPCRHFVRTGGWCPAGDQCKFYHDLSAVQSTSPETDFVRSLEPDAYGEDGRTISGGVLMGMQPPSPPVVSEEYPQYAPSQYSATEQPQSYQDYKGVPAYCWPSQSWQQYPVYYAPAYPVPVTTAIPPAPTMQHMSYPPPPLPPVQAQPPSEPPKGLPTAAYELNGTTYFLPQVATAPPPPPPPAAAAAASFSYPVPHPAPYNHMVPLQYAYYLPPPPPPVPVYHSPEQVADYRPTFFDPFASDPIVPSELPVVPRLQDYQISPIVAETPPLLPVSEPVADPLGTHIDSQTSTGEHEFPYRPPKNQRVGHARRISVNIKKHSHTNSG